MNKLNKKIRDLKKERYLMLIQDNRAFFFKDLRINRDKIRELICLKNLIKCDTAILQKSLITDIAVVHFVNDSVIEDTFELKDNLIYDYLKDEIKLLNFDKSGIEFSIYKAKANTKINTELFNEDNNIYKDFGVSDLSYNDYLYIKDKFLKYKILSMINYYSIRIIFNEEYYKLLEY